MRTDNLFTLEVLLFTSIFFVSCGSKSCNDAGKIKFSRPMIIVNDSEKFIYNEGSKYKYCLLANDDIIENASFVGKDSTGSIYKLPGKCGKDKYRISFHRCVHWPDFDNSATVENYQAYFEIYLADVHLDDDFFRSNRKLFWSDYSFRRMLFSALCDKICLTDYRDSLPDVFCVGDKIDDKRYFVALSTKPQVMLIPDCLWADDDNLSYFPIILDRQIEMMKHDSTGLHLGNYEVWADSARPSSYRLNLSRLDNSGHYSGYLQEK